MTRIAAELVPDHEPNPVRSIKGTPTRHNVRPGRVVVTKQLRLRGSLVLFVDLHIRAVALTAVPNARDFTATTNQSDTVVATVLGACLLDDELRLATETSNERDKQAQERKVPSKQRPVQTWLEMGSSRALCCLTSNSLGCRTTSPYGHQIDSPQGSATTRYA